MRLYYYQKTNRTNRFLGSKHIKVGLARSRSQIVVFRFGDWRGGSKVDRLLKSHESQLGDLHDHGNATVGDVSLERDAFVETVWISAAVSGFWMSQRKVGRQRNRRPLMRGLLSGAAARRRLSRLLHRFERCRLLGAQLHLLQHRPCPTKVLGVRPRCLHPRQGMPAFL